MALKTVQYTKPNSFLTFENSGANIRKYNEENRVVETSPYKKSAAPGAVQRYRPKWNLMKKKWDIDLDDKKLQKLVADCNFSYESGSKEGELITEANVRNVKDPFFCHSELEIFFESGAVNLDDENPVHKILLLAMDNDRTFTKRGDDVNPAMSARVKYTISDPVGNSKIEEKKVDESLEAITMLGNLSFDQQKQILRALGVPVSKPEPGTVKNALFRKITEEKDFRANGGLRNIQAFIKLATMSTEERNLRAVIGHSIGKMIVKKPGGRLYFRGTTYLGKTINEAARRLEQEDFFDIKNEILQSVTLD